MLLSLVHVENIYFKHNKLLNLLHLLVVIARTRPLRILHQTQHQDFAFIFNSGKLFHFSTRSFLTFISPPNRQVNTTSHSEVVLALFRLFLCRPAPFQRKTIIKYLTKLKYTTQRFKYSVAVRPSFCLLFEFFDIYIDISINWFAALKEYNVFVEKSALV